MQMHLSPAGTVTLSGPLDYVSTSQLSWFPVGLTLEEFLDHVEAIYESEGWYIELVAVGFAADASQDSEVSSITFGGNTYLFGNDCGDVSEEGGNGAPTPPDKVDTSTGSDIGAVTFMISGAVLAAAILSMRRRSQTE